MNATDLIVWLPFNENVTRDICGNVWTAHGDLKIGVNGAIRATALQFSGKQYLSLDDGLTLGGQDFTIRGYAYASSSMEQYARVFEFHSGVNACRLELTNRNRGLEFYYQSVDGTEWRTVFGSGLPDTAFDFEIDYVHSESKFYLFINGQLRETLSLALKRTFLRRAGNGNNRARLYSADYFARL